MVGGIVHSRIVFSSASRIYLCVKDPRNTDWCALYVELSDVSLLIREGDALWWQAREAMWTPAKNLSPTEECPTRLRPGLTGGKDFDIVVKRIGYSGRFHPSDAALIHSRPSGP